MFTKNDISARSFVSKLYERVFSKDSLLVFSKEPFEKSDAMNERLACSKSL